MTPENLNTLYTVGGSIIVAVIGPVGIGSLIRRSKNKRIEATTDSQKVAIAQHAADPNMWVAAVTADAAAAREDARVALERAKSAEDKVARIEEHDRRKSVALNRWLTRIARAWGVEDEMPYPHEEDRNILSDIIPTMLEASRPRRSRSTHSHHQDGPSSWAP